MEDRSQQGFPARALLSSEGSGRALETTAEKQKSCETFPSLLFSRPVGDQLGFEEDFNNRWFFEITVFILRRGHDGPLHAAVDLVLKVLEYADVSF